MTDIPVILNNSDIEAQITELREKNAKGQERIARYNLGIPNIQSTYIVMMLEAILDPTILLQIQLELEKSTAKKIEDTEKMIRIQQIQMPAKRPPR